MTHIRNVLLYTAVRGEIVTPSVHRWQQSSASKYRLITRRVISHLVKIFKVLETFTWLLERDRMWQWQWQLRKQKKRGKVRNTREKMEGCKCKIEMNIDVQVLMKENKKAIIFRSNNPHHFIRRWNKKCRHTAQLYLSTARWLFGGEKAVRPHSGTWPFLSPCFDSFWNPFQGEMKLWLSASVVMLSTAHFGPSSDDSRNQQNDILGHEIGTKYKHHPDRSIVLITRLLF